ncbi:MAG: Uncharacterized protein RSP_6119, partial [uncultured Thermoleophilia bacterium]
RDHLSVGGRPPGGGLGGVAAPDVARAAGGPPADGGGPDRHHPGRSCGRPGRGTRSDPAATARRPARL